MTGELDLAKLLKNMSPSLDPEIYIFACVATDQIAQVFPHKPLATFQEHEGTTVILAKGSAEQLNINFDADYRRITLQVHSSLEAVGLTAAVSTRLADNMISANVVAAFYHDHIFVPANDAEKALLLLEELVDECRDA
ncbi:ACT domain-containing protein [Aliikangiella marina]|uniref:ACT domain-containing protein n=1 Tax=Aliikangiella marina TaxID=1712262 RepID=A0A545T8V7_9GAMM|nr:ACT domain-containing protein [Aliikangiella marina]TQV73654.1 ACT domain-containing protein [Aliikangiella marina]